MNNQNKNTDDGEISSRTPLLSSSQRTVHAHDDSSVGDIEDEWSSKNNHNNPRNWSFTYKWITVALVSFIEFLTTMPNFMYAPNITDAQHDLQTTDDTLATFSLTIYVLGFGLGPLLFAPLSEMYGRALIYRTCLSLFLLATVGCALSSSIGMLVLFRFIAGSLGAAPVAIGGAVVGDLFGSDERGTAMSVYQAGQIISAVVGPPIGGVIGSYASWRWVFWIVCILTVCALICTFIVLRETHAPTLKQSIYNASKDDGIADSQDKTLATELKEALSRPLQLLTKSLVVFSCCSLIFLVIGILNLFLTEMSRVFQKVYNITSGQTSSIYLGLALGFVIASAVFGSTNDRIMQMLAERNKGETQPEFRLPAAIAAMPLIVVGLLWYGWTLELSTHWIVPIIGSALAGVGITTVQLSITTYLVDSFDKFSASALAAITMARSFGGAVVPLMGPVFYQHFGQGWGNTIFAAMSLGCSAVPVLLFVYGARWRAAFTVDDF